MLLMVLRLTAEVTNVYNTGIIISLIDSGVPKEIRLRVKRHWNTYGGAKNVNRNIL